MLQNPLNEKLVLDRLPIYTRMQDGTNSINAPCPFHDDSQSSLLVSFSKNLVQCEKCLYHGSVRQFIHDFDKKQNQKETGEFASPGTSISTKAPNDSDEHLNAEKVSGQVYQYLFLKKVKELVTAVEKLESLIKQIKI